MYGYALRECFDMTKIMSITLYNSVVRRIMDFPVSNQAVRVTGVVVLHVCRGIQVCSLYAFCVCVVYSVCVRVHSLVLRLPNLFSGREREGEGGKWERERGEKERGRVCIH